MKKILMLLIVALVPVFAFSACSGEELPMNENDTVSSGDMPDNPQPEEPGLPQDGGGNANLSRGNAFVKQSQLVVMESFPVQVVLEISGDLPTPCNQLTVDVADANEDNEIHVDVYSLIDPAMTCMAVIEPLIRG